MENIYTEIEKLTEEVKNNKERILDLEIDAKIFCSGTSTEQIKIKDIIYALLDTLDFKLIGKEVILHKKVTDK